MANTDGCTRIRKAGIVDGVKMGNDEDLDDSHRHVSTPAQSAIQPLISTSRSRWFARRRRSAASAVVATMAATPGKFEQTAQGRLKITLGESVETRLTERMLGANDGKQGLDPCA